MGFNLGIKFTLAGQGEAKAGIEGIGGALAGAAGKSESATKKISGGLSSISTQLQRLQGLWIAFQGFQLFGTGIKDVVEMADAFSLMQARLKLATGSTTAAAAQFDRLLKIANSMQQPVGDVAQVYLGVSRAAGDLGANQQQLTKFTQGVSASLRVSGTSGAAASGALLQLSQAMGGTNIQAQEFNSLVDGAPELLRAVAANLGTTGISMGELRKRVMDGKLSSKEFFDAFLKGSDDLVKKAAGMPLTIGGSMTEIKNNLLAAVGAIDKELGASSKVAAAMRSFAVLVPKMVDPLVKLVDLLVRLAPPLAAYLALVNLAAPAAKAFGVAKTALTAALARYQLAVAISGTATGTLTGMLRAANVSTLTLTTSISKLGLAFSVLAAAFVGWEIGQWLRDNFVEAQLAGVAFVAGTLRGWELVKHGARVAWAYIGAAWRDTLNGMRGILGFFLNKLAGGLAAVGLDSAAKKVTTWASSVVGATEKSVSLSDELATLKTEYEKADAQVVAITDDMADEAIASFNSEKAHESAEKEVQKITVTKKELSKEVQGLIDKLKQEKDSLDAQIATFGQGELALNLYQAKQQGATGEVLAAITANDELSRTLSMLRLDQENANTALDDYFIAEEQARMAKEESIAAGRDMLESIQNETAALKLSSAEREFSTVMLQAEKDGLIAGSTEYDLYAAKIRAAIVDRDQVKASIKQTEEIAEEWKKTTDQIGQGLTDSLFRAFESGKDFFTVLWEGIKNTFKTTVLQPVIQAVMKPVTGAVGSLLSGGAAAGEGGGGGLGSLLGGGGGGLGSLGSMIGGLGSLGTIFGTGASLALTGGFGAAMGSAGAMASAGMLGSGAAMALGAVAPYAAVAVALYNAFKHEKTPHQGAALNINAKGGVSQAANHEVNNNFVQSTADAITALAGTSVLGLNALDTTFGGKGGFTAHSAFASDNNDPSIGFLNLFRNGSVVSNVGRDNGTNWKLYASDSETAFKQYAKDVAGATKEALTAVALPQWAKNAFNELSSDAGMEEFDETVRNVVAMQLALSNLGDSLRPMGGIFQHIASLSGDAQVELIGMAGGIEALLQKTSQYVSKYYSAEEQAALSAKSIVGSLSGAGVNLAGLDTMAEYRALIESRDVGTTQGREQFVALLDAAAAFADLSKYLADSGQTLYGLAQQSVGFQPAEALTAAVSGPAATGAMDPVVSELGGVKSAVTQGNDDVVAAINTMKSEIAELRLTTEAIATSAASTARQLAAWDDGGAIMTTAAAA